MDHKAVLHRAEATVKPAYNPPFFDREYDVNLSERALVLAPQGRDAGVAEALLNEVGYTCHRCDTIAALTAALTEGAGAAIITDDAIVSADLQELSNWIERQPPWSDFPFVLLTTRGGGVERNPFMTRMTHLFANVIFLERPFHPTTLVGAIDSALRGRRRQYQARSHLTALEEGEQRLRTALRAGNLGEWELNLSTYQLLASTHCKGNFGRSETAPFNYQDVLDSIHPDDRSHMEHALRRCVISGADYAIECRVFWPDGSLHWLELRARVVGNADNTVRSLVGVSTDITDRMLAEGERSRLYQELSIARERTQDALRGEKAFNDLLLRSAPAGIVTYRPDYTISTWNPAMQDLFGLAESDVAGGHLVAILNSEEPDKITARMTEALAGKNCPSEEMEFKHEGTSASWICDIQHAPLTDGVGKVIGGIVFFRDITERRRAEEQLRQAQKMETIGQLTGGVAHDFNNLLMAILGNLDLLQKKIPAQSTGLRRHVEGAIKGAQRGAALTQRLLAFARRQDLRPESVDLSCLLDGMWSLMERSLGPLIQIEMDTPDGLPPATVDANQLELAILNLAVNARDAMPGGGRLKFTLSEGKAPLRFGLGPARYLRLAVIDSGTGMDRITLQRAIEPFFSTKELGKGTGLGLSMVHGLAVQSGGALHLSSVPGEGTVAELWLPVAEVPVVVQEVTKMPVAEAPPSTILVVDDDVLIAMSTVDMIEDLGHKVIEANSAAEALALLRNGAQVDAMVTDHAMPGMTGVELASKVRELRPGLPILLATGYADLPAGMTTDLPRLAKPYQQAELSAQLSKLLQPI